LYACSITAAHRRRPVRDGGATAVGFVAVVGEGVADGAVGHVRPDAFGHRFELVIGHLVPFVLVNGLHLLLRLEPFAVAVKAGERPAHDVVGDLSQLLVLGPQVDPGGEQGLGEGFVEDVALGAEEDLAVRGRVGADGVAKFLDVEAGFAGRGGP
jgi:hypothetical protein